MSVVKGDRQEFCLFRYGNPDLDRVAESLQQPKQLKSCEMMLPAE